MQFTTQEMFDESVIKALKDSYLAPLTSFELQLESYLPVRKETLQLFLPEITI